MLVNELYKNEPEDHMAYLCSETLGQDCDFEYHLFPKIVIGDLKIPQQLSDDDFRVGSVTH